jgi:hypothetical protein
MPTKTRYPACRRRPVHPQDPRAQLDLEADPFGPYEYVEPGARCRGAEGECGNGRCTQREDSCRCMCPACCGDTPDVWGYDGDY